MILCGSGIHARPDAFAFTHEIQRLASAIKGNLVANKVNETDVMGEFFINGSLLFGSAVTIDLLLKRHLQHCPPSRFVTSSARSWLEIGPAGN